MQKGQYPNAYYRVSVKAVIKNNDGKVLAVREGDGWTLPGGGIDHGEDPITALHRELYEEAFITSDFEADYIGAETFYANTKDAMAMVMVYRLKMKDGEFTFKPGEDATEVAFRNPEDFRNSQSSFEQRIYKYGLI